MNFLATIAISLATTILGAWGLINHVPLRLLENDQPDRIFGATITTIAGTDTLTSSRGVINTNFSNLNSDKIENSTTSVAAITTLENLVSVGTITTGVWSGTAILPAKGGTGSTTLSAEQVLLGNGTGNIGVVSGLGTSGQLLTSGGAGVPPTWTSATFDVAANYNVTGSWVFNNASSTFTGLLNVTGDLVVGGNSTTTNATTTTLSISSVASTTDLVVSGTQTGGATTYTASSTAFSCSSGTCTYTGSIPATANIGVGNYLTAGEGGDWSNDFTIFRAGKTTSVILSEDDTSVGRNAQYTFSWSGSDFVVSEDSDSSGLVSVSGTIYWYR